MTTPAPLLSAAGAFANYVDLANALQVDPATINQTAAGSALARATAAIQNVTKRTFTKTLADVVNPRAITPVAFLTPDAPVIALTKVEWLGYAGSTWMTMDPSTYALTDPDAGKVQMRAPGFWSLTANAAPPPYFFANDPTLLRITYDHGFATVPTDIVALCIDVAARLYANSLGLTSVSIGNYSERWGNAHQGGASLTPEEEDRAGAWYLPGAVA